ncbi:MAG: molybdate ABC transporter substrate-binding protein [Methanoregula sp.]|uniref:molybdate ABC transporter substrate-binding protein n=1 Tax=Methanoregula sp. TaxID=2052170 RepID=UPI003C28F109
MQQTSKAHTLILVSIVCGLLLVSAFIAGCTSSTSQSTTPAPTAAAETTAAPVTNTSAPAAVETTVAPLTTPAPVMATSTPKPVYTYSEGNVVAFTAASLSGVSPKLAADFAKMYPGHSVVFNLDGTQALRTQVQNGAYADVFISASNSYTTELTKGGYFVDGTVKPLTSNYVIVILPANNPANIKSLNDLAKPGVKIAMEDKSVPAGTATVAVLANLAKSTYSQDWNNSVYNNVVTYETSEPGVASKVQLGEVDAGFVYESTYTAGSSKYQAIRIPKSDNYLQTYTIGLLKGSTSKGAAADFETFMLSTVGQQDLKDYGFRPIST